MIDWVEAQNEDPIIQKTIKWMHSGKEKSLKYHLGMMQPPQKDQDSSAGKSPWS